MTSPRVTRVQNLYEDEQDGRDARRRKTAFLGSVSLLLTILFIPFILSSLPAFAFD